MNREIYECNNRYRHLEKGSPRKLAKLIRLVDEAHRAAQDAELARISSPITWTPFVGTPYTEFTSPTVTKPVSLETTITSSTVTTDYGDNT